jgi:hypothetical protein
MILARRQPEPLRHNERGNASTSNLGSTYGGEISLSIKSYIPDRADVTLISESIDEDSDVSQYARRSRIQIDWIPERSWLKVDVTDQAVIDARESIPDIVSLESMTSWGDFEGSIAFLVGSVEPRSRGNRHGYHQAPRSHVITRLMVLDP